MDSTSFQKNIGCCCLKLFGFDFHGVHEQLFVCMQLGYGVS